jgi:hypothetical protein
MNPKNQIKRLSPNEKKLKAITIVAPIVFLIAKSTYCQTVNEGNMDILSLAPIAVLLFLTIAFVVWFKRRKKGNEMVAKKDKITSSSRIIFGCFLIFAGIFMLTSTQKSYQKNLATFIPILFSSLVYVTGGIRVFIISKPTVDEDGTVYADFGKRFWANIIDGVLFL